jgi:hypothetical protein
MIKFTIEGLLLIVVLGFGILISLGIMLGALFPWILIGGIVYAIYHHEHKKKQLRCFSRPGLCANCELEQLEKGNYSCQHEK